MEAKQKRSFAQAFASIWNTYKFPLLLGVGWLLLLFVSITVFLNIWGSSRTVTSVLSDWDGGWYISVARDGYQKPPYLSQANVAFFPLFPLLISLLAKTGLSLEISAITITWISFVLALCALYRFTLTRWGKRTAVLSSLFLCFNPASIFLGMAYTESLFLFLSVMAIGLALHKHFLWAALFAGLASGTRSVGLIISILVIYLFVLHNLSSRIYSLKASLSVVLATLFSLSGFILFSWYLNSHTGDPLAFTSVQKFWWRGSGAAGLLNEARYFIGWIKEGATLPVFTFGLMWLTLPISAFTLWVLAKKREFSLLFFVAGGVLLPLVTGTITSMNRYALILFPIYCVFAVSLKKFRLASVGAVFLGLLFFFLSCAVLTHPSHPFMG